MIEYTVLIWNMQFGIKVLLHLVQILPFQSRTFINEYCILWCYYFYLSKSTFSTNQKYECFILKSSVSIPAEEQGNSLMILTTKGPVCTNMGRTHASFLTSFIWLFSFSYLQGMYVCYPQANKCLSLDTCEWQKAFTAWNTNTETNKGALIHEIPQNICGTKPV